MGKGIMDKVFGIMGLDDDEKEIEEVVEEQEEQQIKTNKKSSPVVSIHSQKQMRVVVMEPKSFEESQGIADNLKNRRPVIVNLDNVECDVAKRIVDFCSGTTYALNGSLQKVGTGIYLFVPSNVDIHAEIGEDEKGKSVFTWARS